MFCELLGRSAVHTDRVPMMRSPAATVIALYLALPLALPLALLFCARCQASAQGDDGDALLAARVCHVEAEFSYADCRAIIHALSLRARLRGWTFTRMAVQYSAIDADNKRARFSAQLPDGDEPLWGAETNRKWRKLRAVAKAALHRRTGTPCPGATGWGGAMDPVRDGQRVVVCRERTVNWFYN